jgi:hypothetical protein
MDRCEECGAPIRGRSFTSPLGRRICALCHDKLVGTLIAMNTGDPGLAAATAGNDERRPTGILAWIRRALGRERG